MAGQKQQQPIPDREIKQNAGVSASMALQAGQKAWEYRQAANAAGDPNAREEILAKAINKEIEAESFGKAAKYTQSGAFQGLAAGAGLGVQPGVTLGKITGAIVGGTVSTVTGLLGGGIGSVYGAINGPMWDLGEMASKGVRGVVGDFPNWKSTPAQKKALEKMVMQSKETQAPNQEELERMKSEVPDDMPQSWSQSVSDITAWRPSMPSMPSMKQAGNAVGLGGLGASLGLSGTSQPNNAKEPKSQAKRSLETPRDPKPPPNKSQRISARQKQAKASNQGSETGPQSFKTKESFTKKKPAANKATANQIFNARGAGKPSISSRCNTRDKPEEVPTATVRERRKPRKLDVRSGNANENLSSATAPKRRAPRKLETRRAAEAANA